MSTYRVLLANGDEMGQFEADFCHPESQLDDSCHQVADCFEKGRVSLVKAVEILWGDTEDNEWVEEGGWRVEEVAEPEPEEDEDEEDEDEDEDEDEE